MDPYERHLLMEAGAELDCDPETEPDCCDAECLADDAADRAWERGRE